MAGGGSGERRTRIRDVAAWPRSHLGPLGLALALALLLASSATLQRFLVTSIERPAALLADHPILGGAAFVMLAALSSMLSLFSSVPLVPFAVAAWGETFTWVALFTGWLVGGAASYLVGTTVHHRVERSRVYSRLRYYRQRLRRRNAEFSVVLLFRLAMPAEIPGYVLGMLRYDFGKYLTATALAELPMALATVYAGHLLIAQQPLALAAVILGGGLLLILLYGLFHRRLHEA
jgi:uncharacterized membrane protein YdjX (TVP38/TMEM64 family)